MSNYNAYLEGTMFPNTLKEQVPFTVPNILGQRFCDPSEVNKALKDRGGYDRGLYRPVFIIGVLREVAEVWISLQDNPENYTYALQHGVAGYEAYALFKFDGEHRYQQLIRVDPTRTMFPEATIFIVASVQEGNELFNQFNKLSLTKVSDESELINAFLAGNTTAIDLVKKLEQVELAIADKKDFFVLPRQFKDDRSIPQIAANPWELLCSDAWHPQFRYVKEAIKIWKDVLAKSKSLQSKLQEATEKGQTLSRFEINSWILHGLATLLRFREDLLIKPQPRQAVIDSLAECLDYAAGKQNLMMHNLRTSDRLNVKILPAGTDGVNSCQVWAVVFGNAINQHGHKHGVRIAVLHDATKMKDLWNDIQAEIDQKRKEKNDKRLLKLAS